LSPLPFTLGGPPPTAYQPWSTAGEIINDAAVELGLMSSDLSNPFTSQDPNIIQLCRFLKKEGREIIRSRGWSQSQIEFTFTTAQGQSAYNLPSDFLMMISQTGWNRTNRLPLGGPLGASEWQYLKARLVGVVFTVLFRPKLQQMYIYPDTNTPGGYLIAFEYLSRYWVQPLGQTTVTSDKPSAGTDLIAFDPSMMVAAIKRAFLKGKGYDYSAAEDDYQRLLALAMAVDSPPRVLSLNNRPFMEPLIGPGNLPITGYGS
jgi:hypothetical protein